MATYGKIQFTCVDRAGNIIPGASVSVYKESDGLLATIYSDRAGAVPLGNPFTADASGFAGFHAASAEYRIVVQGNAAISDYRYVPLHKSTIDGLFDTTFAGLANGDVLTYDSATQKWKNAVASGGSGGGVGDNLIINGDFKINSRAYAGASISGYGYDRWRASAAGNAQFSISGYVLTLTAGEIEQRIEVALWGVTNFASTQITVSVDTPADDLTVTWGTVTGTISAGAGRRSVTITSAAGDNSTSYLGLKIKKASGAGTTTFGRVKAEFGASATAWRARTLTQETALCRRYWHRNANVAVIYLSVALNASLVLGQQIDFPVVMRATPTMTFDNAYDGTANIAVLTTAWASVDSSLTNGLGTRGFNMYLIKAGVFTTGLAYTVQGGYYADAEL